jgi:hypothetical protein
VKFLRQQVDLAQGGRGRIMHKQKRLTPGNQPL